MLHSRSVFSTMLHSYGNAAEMSELGELYFARLSEDLGEPIQARDALRPGYVRIEDAPEPDVRPGDAEDAMIALLDAKRL